MTNDDRAGTGSPGRLRDWGRVPPLRGRRETPAARGSASSSGTLPHGFDDKYVYTDIGSRPEADGHAGRDWLCRNCGSSTPSSRGAAPTPIGHGRPASLRRPVAASSEATPHSGSSSWFGFVITVRENAGFPAARTSSGSSKPIAWRPGIFVVAAPSGVSVTSGTGSRSRFLLNTEHSYEQTRLLRRGRPWTSLGPARSHGRRFRPLHGRGARHGRCRRVRMPVTRRLALPDRADF